MTHSPPAMPDEDYGAIEAAVMDTARGRWFLAEYARRNRTADTTVLLAAIERLEGMLAARDQPPTPHEPVTRALPSSAETELFLLDTPDLREPEADQLEDEVDATWVIEEPPSTEALHALAETFEIDAGEVPSVHMPEPPAAPSPVQGMVLAAVLAQAHVAAPPPATPEPPRFMMAPSPAAADPAELDALSFEEKSVYFA